MARIRSIKPEFWTSEQITDCDPLARLLFIGMWTFADDNGIHPGSPKRLKMEVLPSDAVSVKEVASLVSQLVAARLVREYEVGGEKFWQITGWQHQRIDQPTFRYPLPDGSLPRNVRRKFADDSTNPPGTFDEHSGRERRGEERTGKETTGLSEPSSDLLGEKPEQPGKEARVRAVAMDAIRSFNASSLTKRNEGLLSNVSESVGIDAKVTMVRRVIKTAREICLANSGSSVITPEFWAGYWETIAEDDWMSGRKKGGDGHANWTPDFEYLTRQKTMLKVFERASEEVA